MRYGVSWPAGGGRREWVSMGCLGWLIAAPFIMAAYLIGFAAVVGLAVVLLLGWLARGAWLAGRWAWRRWGAR